MRAAASLTYFVVMAVGFWGTGTVELRLSGLLPLGLLASGFVAYLVPWVAPLIPPAALAVAAWMNYAGGLLLAEVFIATGIVLRRRRRAARASS